MFKLECSECGYLLLWRHMYAADNRYDASAGKRVHYNCCANCAELYNLYPALWGGYCAA